MTAIQKQHGPFAWRPEGWDPSCLPDHLMTCDAQDRITKIKASTDPEWLKAVIKDRDVQSTVRLAAERRMKKLRTECPVCGKKTRNDQSVVLINGRWSHLHCAQTPKK